MGRSIGICTAYGADHFTTAFLLFKDNGDVVVTQHLGAAHALDDGTKWNPHVTYHADGTYHVASYDRYFRDEQPQALDSNFKGYEFLIRQSFGRYYARSLGRRCSYDDVICVSVDDLPDRVDAMEDAQGRVESHAALSTFQIDLVEPHTHAPDADQTFPWWRVTILTVQPAAV
jgi:hypothetical protein